MAKQDAHDNDALRVALYMRVSTNPQAERDLSIPDQRRQMQDRCRIEGWQVVREFKDSRSGRTANRPGFQQLFDLVQANEKPFDIVMVHSYSRFFRDAVEFELRYRQLRERGIRLVSICEETEDTPMGRYIRGIFALNDELQSSKTARDVSRSLRENARQGFWCGSRPPYGYTLADAERRGARVKRRLVVDPVEAENVRKIFDLYLGGDGRTGPMGVKAITSWLNENGHRTRSGACWGVAAIHRMLSDPVYKGEYWYNRLGSEDERVRVTVPSIVETATFDAVQRALCVKNPRNTAPRTSNGPTMLTGIARCGKCGYAMTKRTGKSGQYNYYTCSARSGQGKNACEGQSVPMEALDCVIIDFVSRWLTDPKRANILLRAIYRRHTSRKLTKTNVLEAHKKKLDDAEARLRRLYEAIESGLLDPKESTLGDRIVTVTAQRDAARANMASVERSLASESMLSQPTVKRFTTLLRDAIAHGSTDFRRAYLKAVLECVEVHEDVVWVYPRNDTIGVDEEVGSAAAA